jgi:hypothetical protein
MKIGGWKRKRQIQRQRWCAKEVGEVATANKTPTNLTNFPFRKKKDQNSKVLYCLPQGNTLTTS